MFLKGKDMLLTYPTMSAIVDEMLHSKTEKIDGFISHVSIYKTVAAANAVKSVVLEQMHCKGIIPILTKTFERKGHGVLIWAF